MGYLKLALVDLYENGVTEVYRQARIGGLGRSVEAKADHGRAIDTDVARRLNPIRTEVVRNVVNLVVPDVEQVPERVVVGVGGLDVDLDILGTVVRLSLYVERVRAIRADAHRVEV